MTKHVLPGPAGLRDHDDTHSNRDNFANNQYKLVGHSRPPGPMGTHDFGQLESHRMLQKLPMRVTKRAATGASQGSGRQMIRPEEQDRPDVAHLISIFKRTLFRLESDTEREAAPGEVNGWRNNWHAGIGLEVDQRRSTAQAAQVLSDLSMQSETKAEWKFAYAEKVPGPVPVHVWVRAESNNKKDPVLHFDAWLNEVRIEPRDKG